MNERGQLIRVTGQAGSSRAKVTCLERGSADEHWQTVAEYEGWVGKNGISPSRKSGDMTTPAGEFSLDFSFGCGKKPKGVKLPWRAVTPHSHWVGDPESPLFNTWQEAGADVCWDTAPGEWLGDYPAEYEWACTIGFNPPPADPAAGFAIFLHVSQKPTAGCVGLPRDAMGKTLLWLDPEKSPRIFIEEI